MGLRERVRVFCNKRCRPKRIANSPTVSSLKILVKVTGIKTLLDAGSEYSFQGRMKDGCHEGYQRNPLRCSSAISLTMASVCARRYWPTAARMALHQGNGSGVRGAEGKFDSIEARKTSSHSRAQGRKIGVRDADAIGASNACLLGPVDGLSKSAAETDRNYQVLLMTETHEMQNSPCRGGGKNRETQKTDLILEVVREGELPGRRRAERRDVPRRSVLPTRRGAEHRGCFLSPAGFSSPARASRVRVTACSHHGRRTAWCPRRWHQREKARANDV